MDLIDEQAIRIGKIALAMALGGVIGFEREVAQKPAGFRTQMLVAGASALLVLLGDFFLQHFSAITKQDLIQADPFRIIEAIITGISFIAAGTIIRYSKEYQVVGLTTAATILMSGTVGMTVALGRYFLAVAVSALSLLVVFGLSFLEHKVNNKSR